MYMRTLPSRGVPPRGSLQDGVACEFLSRERRVELYKHIYLGRIMAASTMLPEYVFQLWTEIFSSQLYQRNYSPTTIDTKRHALEALQSVTKANTGNRRQVFSKLRSIEARESDLRPMTTQETEEVKRKLRKKRLKSSRRET